MMTSISTGVRTTQTETPSFNEEELIQTLRDLYEMAYKWELFGGDFQPSRKSVIQETLTVIEGIDKRILSALRMITLEKKYVDMVSTSVGEIVSHSNGDRVVTIEDTNTYIRSKLISLHDCIYPLRIIILYLEEPPSSNPEESIRNREKLICNLETDTDFCIRARIAGGAIRTIINSLSTTLRLGLSAR